MDIAELFPSDEALDTIANGIYARSFGSLDGPERAQVFNIALYMRITIQLERIADNLRPV